MCLHILVGILIGAVLLQCLLYLRPILEDLGDEFHHLLARGIERLSRLLQTLTKLFFGTRSEEHTSELQSRGHLVCRLLLEKKKNERQTARDGGTGVQRHNGYCNVV